MSMPSPQSGLFDESPSIHHHLEYRLHGDVEVEVFRAALREAERAARALDLAGVHVMFGFGRGAWTMLRPDAVPTGLVDFAPIGGGDRKAPATQRDLWIWIQGSDIAAATDAALAVHERLKAVAEVGLEQRAFRRPENRGFEGFIDGSANPEGDEARSAAQIPEGEVGAGGSYAVTQQWQHHLEEWNEMSIPEREAMIGRSLADSVEFEGERMRPDSHVSRTDVKVDGVAQKIYRRSLPYGGASGYGLFFIAFACALSRIDIQLQRMFGTTDDGLHDRVTDMSKPLTGSYWFVPSQPDLDAL